ncbi:MAG TPA: dTDP-4-dehydrorhamnose reductase [Burkholderiales bacterium]|nr:dTDP-4-dehydrorhamnose reductase [Burkholderiales bacterium]
MRILLTGRNGQVGWELERALGALGDLVTTDRFALDLSDAVAISRLLREAKPDLIVNAAAYTAVDKAESERDLAMRVNGAGPGLLGEEAKRLGALLVHYSTDYVFDGARRAPYIEADEPRPLSAYAESKLVGERAIQACGCRHLILRTSWVYGPRAANFYQIIRRKADANEPMQMVDDQTSVPTTSAFLASSTLELLKADATGLLHLVPSGAATRYEFAQEVVRRSGSKSSVEAVKTSRFPSPARRPAYSVLSNALAAKTLGKPLPDWKALLDAVR